MNMRSILRSVGLLVLLASVATAQEAPQAAQAGAYDLFGTLKLGYRFTSVSPGDNTGPWFEANANNLFHEQFLLVPSDSSPTIQQMVPLSLSLYGERRAGETGFFDEVFLNADMNPTVAGGSIRLRQFNGYDLNIGYKRVNYFMDRYDSLFTDLRRFDSHRSEMNATLGVTLTDFLEVNVGYQGLGHGGTIDLPRPMFVEGAPSGVVLSADTRNYYLMQMPRTDWNDNFFGSLNASFDMFSVTLGGGYNAFTEDYSVAPVAGGDSLALNFKDTLKPTGENRYGVVGDLTARERMHDYKHTEGREAKGPYFIAQVVATPSDMLSLTGDFRIDKLDMTNTVRTDQMLEYRKTTTAKAFKFYRAVYSGTIENTLDRMRASLVATVMPIDEIAISAGWRMDNSEITSLGDYALAFDTTSSTASTVFVSALKTDSLQLSEWHQSSDVPSQVFFGNVLVTPMNELTLNAGVRMTTRTPVVSRREEATLDSVFTNNLSKKTTQLGIDFGVSYRPIRELRLRGRVEMINRKAEFGADDFAGGPAAGTETDLEPRNAPESILRFDASVDYEILDGLNAGVRFDMYDGSADLNEGMWVLDGPNNKVEFVDKATTISGGINYQVDENTGLSLMLESKSSEYSIPVTWTRGQMMITPLYPLDPAAPPRGNQNAVDSSTVLMSQLTDDIFIDFNASTKVMDALTIGAGVSFMNVTGAPVMTPEVRLPATTPTGEGDITRIGGPFSRMQVKGNIGYDITRNFGVGFEVMFATQNEEQLIDPSAGERLYGYNDFSGLAAAITIALNL